MAKNIVICCDGTGNEIAGHLSNVLKLFQIVEKTDRQIAYYDPGIGTIRQEDAWARVSQNVKGLFELATAYGLDECVLSAYRFLSEHYEADDNIYLFGFSRGAYTVRVLAGLLHLTGLLHPHQLNIAGYLLPVYKGCRGKRKAMELARFRRVTGARTVRIKFVGVWDTVASVIVPLDRRLFFLGFQYLPCTQTNPAVEIFRHAIAVDERRRMFRLNSWTEQQDFNPDPLARESSPVQQDVKQVWFAGVHGDIGAGYAETESGLSKFPLNWMVEEAKASGLTVDISMQNHVVLGHDGEGNKGCYVAPEADAVLHDSLTTYWKALEYLPKQKKHKEPPERSFPYFYIPRGEPRLIPEDARIHYSVFERMKRLSEYQPGNLPRRYRTEGPS